VGWKFAHAALHAMCQVVEAGKDTDQAASLQTQVVGCSLQYATAHVNPRVRFMALQALGQLLLVRLNELVKIPITLVWTVIISLSYENYRLTDEGPRPRRAADSCRSACPRPRRQHGRAPQSQPPCTLSRLRGHGQPRGFLRARPPPPVPRYRACRRAWRYAGWVSL
jgi:hypothetical protein